MNKIERYMELFFSSKSIEVKLDEAKRAASEYGVYLDSLQYLDKSYFFIVKLQNYNKLVVTKGNNIYCSLSGEQYMVDSNEYKICSLSIENCKVMREVFPFMSPRSHCTSKFTLGLGDRLGLASPGHLKLLKGKEIFPVIAQQSIRELTLTGRNYDDVLNDASWATFQEGYTTGFGADGDHLKTKDEVSMALEKGYTMITLDCSDHIIGRDGTLDDKKIQTEYEKIDSKIRTSLEEKYLNKIFVIGDSLEIEFSEETFRESVVLYYNAVKFAIDVYVSIIAKCPRQVDFEMSVDETFTSTTKQAHFFVARELIDNGAKPVSLAPRFYGEFQKGIDYIGDVDIFRQDFVDQVAIAKHFGYKLSVHSGSDKFSIFQIIASESSGTVHLKTAGTNWLEALRVIGVKEPSLLRKIYSYALENLSEAKKYYHVSVQLEDALSIKSLSDEELSVLLELPATRQILHITYGLVLLAKNEKGESLFRDEIYATLNAHEETYYKFLIEHIGKHIYPFIG